MNREPPCSFSSTKWKQKPMTVQDVKQQAALGSIAASAGLALAKLIVGLLSGSLAVLSEAAHASLDLAATVFTYFAVRISGKPADEEHQYGHGKIESVAALAETALLFLLSAIVILKAVERLTGGVTGAIEVGAATFVVIVASIGVDFFRARLLSRIADQTSSQALEADALHFRADMWSSLAVLVGLGGVALGFPRADAIAAGVVAVFVGLAGWRLGKRTIDTLTDVAPAGVAEQVTALAHRTVGVVGVDRVRARPAGTVLFIDVAITISRTLPLDQVERLKTDLIRAIRAEMKQAEVTVTSRPLALDDETVVERVMIIARNRGLAVHHVMVQTLAGKQSISLDLEIDGDLPLAAAHDIATGLEAAIAAEFGSEVEVETHIEPLQVKDDHGRDAPAGRVAVVQAVLAELAAVQGPIRDVHEVRVRETRDGEIVNFHCTVEPTLSVHDVHERVDELERGLRRRWPVIKRVIGHAEPRR
jgi:cation diffusion facilitator family transporter